MTIKILHPIKVVAKQKESEPEEANSADSSLAYDDDEEGTKA